MQNKCICKFWSCKNSPDFYEIYKIKNNYIIVRFLKHKLFINEAYMYKKEHIRVPL